MDHNCVVASCFSFYLGITYSFLSELDAFMVHVNIAHKKVEMSC